MRNLTSPLKLLSAAVLVVGLIRPALAEPRTYEIDPEHFSIGFMIGHVGYEKMLGMFLEGKGSFVYDESAKSLKSGTVTIQSDSLFTNHEKRDEHVKSDDFLNVDDYDTITFKAKELKTDDGKTGTLGGDLTMLGQTHPVELDVTLNKAAEYPFGHEEYTLGVSARTTIQRSKWGMEYGVENNLVGDDVDIILEFEAIRQ
ncbi:YceI family protein [Allohahella marinimesophila]|uniref:YceI family protein n=1 Tax=Allohahella marinimesophila TaxID=1054972 RepID=A0ABP7NKK8_9GAMM